MAKPATTNVSAKQDTPPEQADADVDVKPEEGSAEQPSTPIAQAKASQAPPPGSAS